MLTVEPWPPRSLLVPRCSFADALASQGPIYALRWFTPGGEVTLCGHATLAAAFALWEEGMVDPATAIRFSTASGVLTCRRDGEGWVEMDFPQQARWLFFQMVDRVRQERVCCVLPLLKLFHRYTWVACKTGFNLVFC